MTNIKLSYDIDGDDFTRAGEASASVKKNLRQLGVDPGIIRKVAIALYEGEINMVIHAHGGTIDVEISSEEITMTLTDRDVYKRQPPPLTHPPGQAIISIKS